jgi:radical SAM protein with 4Fe4S-binding SPASM domain
MTRMKETESRKNSAMHLSAPAYAILELTYACPANCPGCPGKSQTRMGPPRSELSLTSWEKIVEHIAPHVEEVRLSGGEAVNCPCFGGIVEALERNKLPFMIFTAGLWDKPEHVIQVLKSSRFFRGFSFSLHGSRENVHDHFLRFFGFDRAIENLKRSVIEGGFPVQTSSVLGEFNKMNIRDLLKLIFELGSKAHLFHRFIGPIVQGVSIYRDDLAILLAYIGKIKQGGLPVFVDGCYPRCYNRGEFSCLAGITHCTIDPYGNVRDCPFSETIFGNIEETSLKKIWSCKRFRGYVEQIPDRCQSCTADLICHGGCHAMRDRFHIRHDPLMEEPIDSSEIVPGIPNFHFPAMGGKPIAHFRKRKELFGYALIHSGEVVSVQSSMKDLISYFKGKKTLRQIEERFGEEGLRVTFMLYQKGFVDIV